MSKKKLIICITTIFILMICTIFIIYIVKNKDKIIESIDILCAKEIERKNIFSYLKEIIDSYNLNIIL